MFLTLIIAMLAITVAIHNGVNWYRLKKSVAPVNIELKSLERAQSLAKNSEAGNQETPSNGHRKKGETKVAFFARLSQQKVCSADGPDQEKSTVIDMAPTPVNPKSQDLAGGSPMFKLITNHG